MATDLPVFLEFCISKSPTLVALSLLYHLVAADEDGKLLAMKSDWTVDHGPYSEFGDSCNERSSLLSWLPYSKYQGQGRTVAPIILRAAFRGYGSPNHSLSEVLADMMAKMEWIPLV